MYVWPESVAGRGSNEIISCLNKLVQNKPPELKHLIVWSDSCAGQNKNHSLLSYYYYLITRNRFESIQHKYPIPGHTKLPCDRDFASIEKAKRNVQSVYVPSQWVKPIAD